MQMNRMNNPIWRMIPVYCSCYECDGLSNRQSEIFIERPSSTGAGPIITGRFAGFVESDPARVRQVIITLLIIKNTPSCLYCSTFPSCISAIVTLKQLLITFWCTITFSKTKTSF